MFPEEAFASWWILLLIVWEEVKDWLPVRPWSLFTSKPICWLLWKPKSNGRKTKGPQAKGRKTKLAAVDDDDEDEDEDEDEPPRKRVRGLSKPKAGSEVRESDSEDSNSDFDREDLGLDEDPEDLAVVEIEEVADDEEIPGSWSVLVSA
jgi:hypothetical protein